MRQKLVMGNWKMHGSLQGNAALLADLVAGTATLTAAVAVCPPYPYLAQVTTLLAESSIAVGAQNLSEQTAGAFTGEVAGAMLKELGCGYVLVGHSERRTLYGESDALVAAKFAAAQRQGLIPVLCVGETQSERDAAQTEAVVARQIMAVVDLVDVAALANAVVAYEPVWAIGTGKVATPAQAQEVHVFIRQLVAGQDAALAAGLQLLYGGSVKPQNAAELFGQPDIDGGLIGGASLVAADFLAICAAA
jgi:triosephosphate isomerase